MKVLKKLKRSITIVKYKAPTKIIISTQQALLCERLAIPIEIYARELIKFDKYKYGYRS